MAWPRFLVHAALISCLAVASSVESASAGPLSTLATFNFNTNFNGKGGTVLVDLFDVVTPATVANFKQYVSGDASHTYNNTVIHRSLPNFVVQGGGYRADQLFTGSAPNHIATFSPVVNEFHLSSLRGTIAMAKLGGDPNSATSEWFYNLADNSANLDHQNGGFTVFGQVVGTGMTDVIDQIEASQPSPAQLPNGFTFDGFQGFPLKDYTLADAQASKPVTLANIFVLNGITLSTHPAFQNPVNELDVNNDGAVHANDVAAIINDLLNNNNNSHSVGAQFVGTKYQYVDINGDGIVNAKDVLAVINSLLSTQSQSPAQATPAMTPLALPMAMQMAIVPEPSTCVLTATGALALGGYVLCLRRHRLAKCRLTH